MQVLTHSDSYSEDGPAVAGSQEGRPYNDQDGVWKGAVTMTMTCPIKAIWRRKPGHVTRAILRLAFSFKRGSRR
jgi:hypothetical protein